MRKNRAHAKFAAGNQQSEQWNLTSGKSSFGAFDWTNDIFHW